MKIQILDEVQQDLIDGYRFYEDQSPGLGDYFLDSLYSDIESLKFYAGIHSLHHGYHRLLAKRFPFAIYGRVQDLFSGASATQCLPDVVDQERIENADISDTEPPLAVIEDRAGGDPFDFQRRKALQPLEKIVGKCAAGLDLDWRKRALFSDEQIDLVPMGVAEKIDLRPDPLVESSLHEIGLQVAVVKPSRFEPFFVKPRKTSTVDNVEGVPHRLIMANFITGEGPQGQHGGPARQ
jgi:hypothetical protein